LPEKKNLSGEDEQLSIAEHDLQKTTNSDAIVISAIKSGLCPT
jgi:hypothetical protein